MSKGPDYEALISQDNLRQNGNIPGDLVFHLWQLDNIFDQLEDAADKLGIPDSERYDLRDAVPGYLELTRSERSTGPEQLVRSFQGGRPVSEGGQAPSLNLAPRSANGGNPGPVTVVVDAGRSLNGDRKRRRWGLGR